MLQKPLQILELFQGFDQFLEVFQPPRCLGRFILLPHAGIAGFVQNHLGQFDMSVTFGPDLTGPTIDSIDQRAQFG